MPTTRASSSKSPAPAAAATHWSGSTNKLTPERTSVPIADVPRMMSDLRETFAKGPMSNEYRRTQISQLATISSGLAEGRRELNATFSPSQSRARSGTTSETAEC